MAIFWGVIVSWNFRSARVTVIYVAVTVAVGVGGVRMDDVFDDGEIPVPVGWG
jgi:hypothetical protein